MMTTGLVLFFAVAVCINFTDNEVLEGIFGFTALIGLICMVASAAIWLSRVMP